MKNSRKFFLMLTFLFSSKISFSEEKTKWGGISLKFFSGAKIGKDDGYKNLTFSLNGIPLISGSGSLIIGGSAEYGIIYKNLYGGIETSFSNLSLIPIVDTYIGYANDYFSLGGGLSLILWGANLYYRHSLTTNLSLETKINFAISGEAFSKEHALYDSRILYTLGLRYTI